MMVRGIAARGVLLAAAGLLGLVLSACTERSTPEEVAARFWSAVQAGDARAARSSLAGGSYLDSELEGEGVDISAVRFGRTIIDGDRATVETTIVMGDEDPLEVPLDTVLHREGGEWRVHYRETMAALSGPGDLAQAIARLRALGRRVKEDIGQTMKEAVPEVKREIERLEAQIREQIPLLREQLERMLHDLEEQLERALDPPVDQPREA